MPKVRAARILLIALAVLVVGRVSIRSITWRLDYTVEAKIIIKDRGWNAEIRSDRCIFSCYAYQGQDIRLVNDTSGDRVELVEGADVLTDDITSDSPGELKITLANLTLATLHQVQVPGVHIFWNITPRDDPDERNAHRAWVFGDKTLAANRDWYCQRYFPQIPGDDRSAVDRSVAFQVYGFGSSNQHYCLSE